MKSIKVRSCVCLLIVLMLSACSNKPMSSGTGLFLNAIEVVNLTRDDIRNMKIEVTKFHSQFACGIILHRSTCMSGFHKRELQGNDVVITWQALGQPHQAGPIQILPPKEFDPEMVYAVRFVFKSVNQINLEFRPSSY